jgi:hypothetical protein
MWICMDNCFVSAVEDRDDPNGLLVRARKQEHLTRLFPSKPIAITPEADYAARVFVTKAEFAAVITERITAISYPNFKNSVRDHRLHQLYSEFWTLHWRYQRNREGDWSRLPPALSIGSGLQADAGLLERAPRR